jgi:hypothetical protein
MAIVFIDDEIRGQLANSIKFSRDFYAKPSNILLEHPNGEDYIVLKNRHFYNHDKQIRPSDINEYTKLEERVVYNTILNGGYHMVARELNVNGMNLIIDKDFLNPNGQRILEEMISVSEENNFEIGDKVVPTGDSLHYPIDETTAWKGAKQINQPFLYVVGFGKIKGKCSVNVNYVKNGCPLSYFTKENLKHYEEQKIGVAESEEEEQEYTNSEFEYTVEELIFLIETGILQPQDVLFVKRVK